MKNSPRHMILRDKHGQRPSITPCYFYEEVIFLLGWIFIIFFPLCAVSAEFDGLLQTLSHRNALKKTMEIYKKKIQQLNRFDSFFSCSADSLTYDGPKKMIQASGHVLLVQKDIDLIADMIQIFEKEHCLFFKGKAKIKDSIGLKIACSEGQLYQDLARIFVRKLTITTPMGESITAAVFVHRKKSKSYLHKLNYAPAPLPGKPNPPWAFSAQTVLYNNQTHMLHCHGNALKIRELPSLYLPNICIKTGRQSQFLLPYIRWDNQIGGGVFGLPYFLCLSHNDEITITPFGMTSGGLMLSVDYCRTQENWRMKMGLAANKALSSPSRYTLWEKNRTHPSFRSWRGYGHLDILGHITPNWDFFIDEWWVSDKTFLSTRPFFRHVHDSFLESQTGVTYRHDHAFLRMRHLRYNSLQKDKDPCSPVIFPEIKGQYCSLLPGKWGGITAHTYLTHLVKKNLLVSDKLYGSVRWDMPVYAYKGHDFRIFTQQHMAIRRWQKHPKSYLLPCSKKVFQSAFIFLPQIGASSTFFPQDIGIFTLTPYAQIVISPQLKKQNPTPNEDSQHVFFGPTSLFSLNRYGGTDRLDDGCRLDYGTYLDVFKGMGCSLNCFIGQSFSFQKKDSFMNMAGVFKGFSDPLLSVDLHFDHMMIAYYATYALNKKRPHTHQAIAHIYFDRFHFTGTYIQLNQKLFSQDLDHSIKISRDDMVRQISIALQVPLNAYFSGTLFVTKDLHGDGGWWKKSINKGIGLLYQDTSIEAGLNLYHKAFVMDDIRPGFGMRAYLTVRQAPKEPYGLSLPALGEIWSARGN